jgi:hypothetical protein
MAADAPPKIDDHAVFDLSHLFSCEVILKLISFHENAAPCIAL